MNPSKTFTPVEKKPFEAVEKEFNLLMKIYGWSPYRIETVRKVRQLLIVRQN